MVEADQVENRVLAPLTDARPTANATSCPFVSAAAATSTLSCRYLVDRAVEDALLDAPEMTNTIEQKANTDYAKELIAKDLDFVKSWVGQAVLSGIDVGAVHGLGLLREKKLCDQAPDATQSAFQHGEGQGKALLEKSEQELLPTILADDLQHGHHRSHHPGGGQRRGREVRHR